MEVLGDVMSVRGYALTTTYLIKPDIITKMDIMVKLRIASIGRPSTLQIPAKNVDNAMLNFLRNFNKVHVVPTPCWTLDLAGHHISQLPGTWRIDSPAIRPRNTGKSAGGSR
jgi:hypothetical protein